MVEQGFELEPFGSVVRWATGCAMQPGNRMAEYSLVYQQIGAVLTLTDERGDLDLRCADLMF